MSAASDEVVAFVRDVAKRAAHTWWQAFGGLLAVEWGSAGIDIQSLHDLTDMSTVQKVGAAVAAAALAAGGSTVKSLLANVKLRKRAKHVATDVIDAYLPVDVVAKLAAADEIHPVPKSEPEPDTAA